MPRLEFENEETGKKILIDEDGVARTPDGRIVEGVHNAKDAIRWLKKTETTKE